jgi:predicted acylesterase/phospholipase RssA
MDRYCDIVMKGGITSGVVYPLAAVELARHYRFRNLGGTSAGAIAAAAAAAAEHGRNSERGTSFEGLAELPRWLGGNLASLFQPSPGTQPLFAIVMATTRATGGAAKTSAAVAAAIGAFGYPILAGALPGTALVVLSVLSMAGVLAGSLPLEIVASACGAALAVIGAAAGFGVAASRRLARAVPENYYGLCSGYTADERARPKPLTTWLADTLDELAGKDDPAEPLTFGDLWGPGAAEGKREVSLEMITTNLTQGRPMRLPFETGEFWFSEREFRDLFPARIVDWMVDRARPSKRGRSFDGLHHLPEPAQMPVVVAARMSLSFPLLISAVPLYAIDHSRQDVDDEAREPERCWFSDGGITSNFPVHFFDSPVPRWPTLGINLRPFDPRDWEQDPSDDAKSVRMPRDNNDGLLARWNVWEERSGLGRLIAFLLSIPNTSRNWMDNEQMRVPGYRDRIVHIAHAEDEGGMNLAMPKGVVERMSLRGKLAAEELYRHYGVPPGEPTPLTWDNQRWVRYRSFMALLEDTLERLHRGCLEHHPEDRTIEQLSRRGDREPPGYRWSGQQGEFALDATARVLAVAKHFEHREESFTQGAPRPRPELRVTPRM